MRITILLLLVGLCIVSAKYLPYENESSVLLRSRRSNSEESSSSAESNNESKNNEDDDDNVNSKEQTSNEERRKEEEQRRKLQEKLAKEQRKQEEKREKEERKRFERIEKEKRKEEEKNKKLLEKAEKEEKKRQEKQRKELEKLQKEALLQNSNEDSFLETEEESSVELGSIWRNHIYVKYGLTLASTNAEKKAALDRYLKEELGVNSNSTQSERQQAIIKLIETRLQNDTASKEAIRNQLLNQINSITINKLRNKLDHNIEKLNNKTNTLINVTLPWASIAQQKLEEKRTFLQSISQFLSNVLPNWAPKAENLTSNSTLEQNVQGEKNEISLLGKEDEISADKNVVSGLLPTKLSPSGSSIVINSNVSDFKSNIAAGNNIEHSQSLGETEKSPDNDIFGQGNEKVIVGADNSPASSSGANNSPPKSALSNVVPVLSDAKLIGDNNKPVEPANKEVDNASSVLGSIDNTLLSNVDNASESSAASSINVETSVSSGQLSNNEYISTISINDSNISSVNTSNDANRDSDAISQSASDIMLPSSSSVQSNSIQASVSDVVSEVNITKNQNTEPSNGEISDKAPVDANKDQPSLNVLSSNNVQTSESIAKQNIESNIISKTNGESAGSSISNVSESAFINKVNSSENVKANIDINKKSDVIPAENSDSLSSNTSSVDVLGVILESNDNTGSSLNNNSVNISSTVDKISANSSSLSDIALQEIDISTSSPSIVESTYDVASSISSQNNEGNISTTVNVKEIVTSSPVHNDISNSLNNKTVQVANNDILTDSETGNLIQNSSLLEVNNVSLAENHTSASDLVNVGITNETNIPNSVMSLNSSNGSSIVNITDSDTTASSIDNKILIKTNESNSNAIASSVPVVIADSTTVSPVVTTSADVSIASTSNINNITENIRVADNSNAAIGTVNVTTESSNSPSVQKVDNESATSVGIEASTEPFLGESTVTDLGALSTLSETVSNDNIASSNVATDSSLLDIPSVQIDNSQSLSTAIPADPSTSAQADGITLPAELGASVVEILTQV